MIVHKVWDLTKIDTQNTEYRFFIFLWDFLHFLIVSRVRVFPKPDRRYLIPSLVPFISSIILTFSRQISSFFYHIRSSNFGLREKTELGFEYCFYVDEEGGGPDKVLLALQGSGRGGGISFQILPCIHPIYIVKHSLLALKNISNQNW